MEHGIIARALENVMENAGIHAEWEEYMPEGKLQDQVDGKVNFKINRNIEVVCFAEVKKEIRKHHIPQLKKIAENNHPLLLIADRLYPNLKEDLKEENINWLDGAGNMYLKDPHVLIWIDRHTTTPVRQTKNRAFTKTGLKVVFLFLYDEKWVNKTYRKIAGMADVALGNITHVLNGLRENNFLVKETEQRDRLIRKNELLDRWVTAFADELKPRLHVGNFQFINHDHQATWKDLNLEDGDVWGGEPGADLLTHNLKPVDYLLYTQKTKTEIMNGYRLKPDKQGPVKVYRPYWAVEHTNRKDVAPALVVYADLVCTGEPRNLNVANKIHEEFLNHLT